MPASVEQPALRLAQDDRDLGRAVGQALARAQEERDALPARVVDPGAHAPRTSRRSSRGATRSSSRYPGTSCPSTTPADVLAPDELVRGERAHGLEQLRLAVADVLRGERVGRLHRHEREHLEQVVLDHVAQRAGLLVVAAAPLDAGGLGDRDLDVVDRLAAPRPLDHRVGEPEDQDVLHRLLAEVVVDAEDLRLVEDLAHDAAELARARQVVPDRLLEHDPRVVREAAPRRSGGRSSGRPTAACRSRTAAGPRRRARRRASRAARAAGRRRPGRRAAPRRRRALARTPASAPRPAGGERTPRPPPRARSRKPASSRRLPPEPTIAQRSGRRPS